MPSLWGDGTTAAYKHRRWPACMRLSCGWHVSATWTRTHWHIESINTRMMTVAGTLPPKTDMTRQPSPSGREGHQNATRGQPAHIKTSWPAAAASRAHQAAIDMIRTCSRLHLDCGLPPRAVQPSGSAPLQDQPSQVALFETPRAADAPLLQHALELGHAPAHQLLIRGSHRLVGRRLAGAWRRRGWWRWGWRGGCPAAAAPAAACQGVQAGKFAVQRRHALQHARHRLQPPAESGHVHALQRLAGQLRPGSHGGLQPQQQTRR